VRISRVVQGAAARAAMDRAERLWAERDVPLTARAPWLRAYLDAYRDRQPVVVEIVEIAGPAGAGAGPARHGRPVAVACLGRVDGPVVEWTALGIEVSDYTALVAVDDDAARRLAGAIADLVRGGRRPWRLRLEQLPAGDPVLRHLGPLLPAVTCRPGIPALRLALSEPRVLERHLSHNARRTVRKGWNRLARDGHEVVVRPVRDPVGVRAVLDAVVELRRTRDRQIGRRSELDRPDFARFYRGVLPELAARGQVELTTLWVGDELAGYVLGFLDGSSYRMWDGRVGADWLAYSTGRLADALALTSALADPRIRTLDWMRGEQEYKRQAMTHVVDHEHLHAWSSHALRRGYRLVLAGHRRLRRLTAPGGLRRAARRLADRVRPAQSAGDRTASALVPTRSAS
jgi:CelD/BcsL family acetyltransferase involved in cellulose biosynthesis